jgi:hypothetical protein
VSDTDRMVAWLRATLDDAASEAETARNGWSGVAWCRTRRGGRSL